MPRLAPRSCPCLVWRPAHASSGTKTSPIRPSFRKKGPCNLQPLTELRPSATRSKSRSKPPEPPHTRAVPTRWHPHRGRRFAHIPAPDHSGPPLLDLLLYWLLLGAGVGAKRRRLRRALSGCSRAGLCRGSGIHIAGGALLLLWGLTLFRPDPPHAA